MPAYQPKLANTSGTDRADGALHGRFRTKFHLENNAALRGRIARSVRSFRRLCRWPLACVPRCPRVHRSRTIRILALGPHVFCRAQENFFQGGETLHHVDRKAFKPAKGQPDFLTKCGNTSSKWANQMLRQAVFRDQADMLGPYKPPAQHQFRCARTCRLHAARARCARGRCHEAWHRIFRVYGLAGMVRTPLGLLGSHVVCAEIWAKATLGSAAAAATWAKRETSRGSPQRPSIHSRRRNSSGSGAARSASCGHSHAATLPMTAASSTLVWQQSTKRSRGQVANGPSRFLVQSEASAADSVGRRTGLVAPKQRE